MTQKEFEERIGREVSTEEYAYADSLYLNCEMDKDDFCEQYAALGRSTLVKELSVTIDHLNKRLDRALRVRDEWEKRCETLQGIMTGVSDRIYTMPLRDLDSQTRNLLVMLADSLILEDGKRIYYKCKHGVSLNESDLQSLEYLLGLGEQNAEDASAVDRMAIG